MNKDAMGPNYFNWVVKDGFLFHVLKQQNHKHKCFGPSKNGGAYPSWEKEEG